MTAFKTMITAATVGLFVTSAPAFAAENEDGIEVSYADLNLSSQVGREILDRRLRNAVQSACGGPVGRNLSAWRATRKCIDDTMPEAEAQARLAVASFEARTVAHKDRKIRLAVR